MEVLFSTVLLFLGFAMLIKGADRFVDGASALSEKLGIPRLIIGLTVVAMGTSAPEAAVSITAALKKSADITIGNIVGSNIINILIILGISAIVAPLTVSRSTSLFEIPFMSVITLLLLFQGKNGYIGLFDGIILLLIFTAFLTYLLAITVKKNNSPYDTQTNIEIKDIGLNNDSSENIIASGKKVPILIMVLQLIIGLALIIAGSNIAVSAACKIADFFNMSERFIGLTIVALGTSLPELFTSVSAAKKGNADIAIGNIVGSNIFNILFVIGISSVITNIPFSERFYFDTVIAVLSCVLLMVCCAKCRKITQLCGIVMLVCYAAYFFFIL